MGVYLNPGSAEFEKSLVSMIYVDKFIPNSEVPDEFVSAIKGAVWNEMRVIKRASSLVDEWSNVSTQSFLR